MGREDEPVVTEVDGVRLVNVHDPSLCAGQACVIHNPTDHPMRSWELLWRGDRRIFERVCPVHGCGHPDPDQFDYWRSVGSFEWQAVHGCCGCCRNERTRPPVDKVAPVDSLPPAIIVDIDGTLTHGPHNRSPYDYTRVHQDLPNLAVIDIINRFKDTHTIIVMTGRDDDCRTETVDWLASNGVYSDYLYMRDTRNDIDEFGKLPDYDVKLRLFDENVRGKYNVTHVFDDRLQVCELWFELGLSLFRVGDPNANF